MYINQQIKYVRIYIYNTLKSFHTENLIVLNLDGNDNCNVVNVF